MSEHKCRYCIHAVQQDIDLIYCEVKHQLREKKNCIQDNKCKDFEFCKIDVFDLDKEYKPKPTKRNVGEQLKLF